MDMMEYIIKVRCQTSGSYTNTIYVAGSFVVNGDLAIGKEHIKGKCLIITILSLFITFILQKRKDQPIDKIRKGIDYRFG